jgi:hypothetical protein
MKASEVQVGMVLRVNTADTPADPPIYVNRKVEWNQLVEDVQCIVVSGIRPLYVSPDAEVMVIS